MEFTRRGIIGIKGFYDRINLERTRFKAKMRFPDFSTMGQFLPLAITVGTHGEMFPAIGEALDSIRDASATKPYNVLISGGKYIENITVPSYVHLSALTSGLALSNVEIEGIAGNPTVTISGHSSLTGITLDNQGADAVLNITSSTYRVFNCLLLGPVEVSGSCNISVLDTECFDWDFDNGSQILELENVGVAVGDFVKNSTGSLFMQTKGCIIYGRVIITGATNYLEFFDTNFYNVWSGTVPLQLSSTGYLQLFRCVISGDAAVDSIDITDAGNLNSYTAHNLLSSAFNAQVVDKIGAPNNIIDVDVADLRTL